MGAMASQITSLTIVYSTVYSDADERKHQSSASLAFVRGIHRAPVNSSHKWPATRKTFPFDDVIMAASLTPLSLGSVVRNLNCVADTLVPKCARLLTGLVLHYNDIIMTAMVSQITGVSVVCSTVCSGTAERKHQISASLALEESTINWWFPSQRASNAPGECFHLMTSSCDWFLASYMVSIISYNVLSWRKRNSKCPRELRKYLDYPSGKSHDTQPWHRAMTGKYGTCHDCHHCLLKY